MENSYPSVAKLVCPSCGKNHLKILGTKGAVGAAIGGAMFGAIGNIVASNASKNDFEVKTLRFQCEDCKNKFESLPQSAEADELLSEPCTIQFHRLSSMVGMAVIQQVYLNGVKIGNVKNNGELIFKTHVKQNVIFVTDQYGVAFPDSYTFTAAEGGTETVNFKRKFV